MDLRSKIVQHGSRCPNARHMIFNAVSLQPWVAAFSGGKQKSMIGMHASLDGLQEHALKTPVLSQQAVILAERAADLLVLTGSSSEEL